MTNKVYYQSKNPVACIAFANWIQSILFGRTMDGFYVSLNAESQALSAKELYQIWEDTEIDPFFTR